MAKKWKWSVMVVHFHFFVTVQTDQGTLVFFVMQKWFRAHRGIIKALSFFRLNMVSSVWLNQAYNLD